MSVTANKDVPAQATLGTTLTRVITGDGVREVQLSTPQDVYVVYDNSLTDSGAVPATARHRLPAGVWTLRVTSTRILLAGVNGTVIVTLLGGSAGAFGAAGGASGGGGGVGLITGLQQGLIF